MWTAAILIGGTLFSVWVIYANLRRNPFTPTVDDLRREIERLARIAPQPEEKKERTE